MPRFPFRRLRFLRARSRRRPLPDAPPTTITLHALGLHRLARQAIRDLQERVHQLDALVGLLDSLSAEVQPGDSLEHLRGATTMLRAALREVVGVAIEAAVAVGQVRFVGLLRGIEVEGLDGEEGDGG